MNAEDRRFMAACHAMGGILACPLTRPDLTTFDKLAEEAVEVGDALIRRLAETAPAAEPEPPPAAAKKRVLIHVVGGVASYVADPDIDVEVIDWDDDATMPLEHVRHLRTQFAGLITEQQLAALEHRAS
jgi:hypothetical protein